VIDGAGGKADAWCGLEHPVAGGAMAFPTVPAQPDPGHAARSPAQRGLDSRAQGDFGERWIQMIAAAAGLSSSVEGVERSIGEIGITYSEPVGSLADWQIRAQVKTISAPRFDAGHIAYDLDASAHRRLTALHFVPVFLFLVVVCPDRASWIQTAGSADILHHGAYWLSLNGRTPTANKSSQVVHVPLRNRLSPASMRELCESTAHEYLKRDWSQA
jgi:hypothetical protein